MVALSIEPTQAPVTTPQDDDLITYQEACKIAEIKLNTLYAAIKRKRLHPVRAPGAKRAFLLRGEVIAYRDRRPYIPPDRSLALAQKARHSADALEGMGHIERSEKQEATTGVLAVLPGSASGASADDPALATVAALASMQERHDRAVVELYSRLGAEARIAMQPQIDGVSMAAAFQMIANIQAKRFTDAVGPELLDRLARRDHFSHEDLERLIAAFHDVLTTPPQGLPPYSERERESAERVFQMISQDARQMAKESGALYTGAAASGEPEGKNTKP